MLIRRSSRASWPLLLAALMLACAPAPDPAADSLAVAAVRANAREQTRPTPPPVPESPKPAGPGFRSTRLLAEHFDKHGREFGTITRQQYLALAQALRDAPLSDDVLEVARPDGTTSRFQRSTGSFLAFNRDGTIRTFFKPNDGERYFRRQARRRGA